MTDIFTNLVWMKNVADIVIVATIIYWLMLMVRNTRAERMLWGLGVIILIYFVSDRMELFTLHWILNNFLSSLIIIIIVIFQHDIRRALIQVGKSVGTTEWQGRIDFINEIAKAVYLMSTKKIGALVAMERDVGLKDYIEYGTDIDAKVTKEMLLSVFNPNSPLHDGAVIVQNGRLSRAGCLLPLSSQHVSKELGTRHRAALGLSEETDAVVIVVSEETGEISLVVDRKFERGLDIDTLNGRLRMLIKKSPNMGQSLVRWLKT